MKYTFCYKRIELGRLLVQCVEIPQFHTEQLSRDSAPEKVLAEVTESFNLFLSIVLLIGQKIITAPIETIKSDHHFEVIVSKTNETKLRRILS